MKLAGMTLECDCVPLTMPRTMSLIEIIYPTRVSPGFFPMASWIIMRLLFTADESHLRRVTRCIL
jgi:hypothetical protein